MTLPLCTAANQQFFLGNPPNMLQMLIPDSSYTTALDAAIVDHLLVGGGHGIQRAGKVRRRYGLVYSARTIENADQITSIYYGMLGPAPYFFIDPMWRNVLQPHVSSCARRLLNTAGLVPTVGTVAYGSAVAPPAAASGVPSGVQTWTGAGNGSLLYINAASAGVLEPSAPPCQLNLLPLAAGLSLRTASSTANVSVQLYFNDASGALLATTTLATATLTTTWQRISGSMLASAIPSTAVTFGIRLLCNTAAAPAISLSAVLAQYATPGTSGLPAWVLGVGVPKVSVGAPTTANHAHMHTYKSQTLDLVEL